jgi:hypothetical protein
MNSSTYVRLVVTLNSGRSFALPPMLIDEARRMDTDLRNKGHKEFERGGRVIRTPSTDIVAVDFIPCQAPARDKQAA